MVGGQLYLAILLVVMGLASAQLCPSCGNKVCRSSEMVRVSTDCRCHCFLPMTREVARCPKDCGVRFEHGTDGSFKCKCAPGSPAPRPRPPAAQCPACHTALQCPDSPGEGQFYLYRVTTACGCYCFLPSSQQLDDCPRDCRVRFQDQPDGSLRCNCAPPDIPAPGPATPGPPAPAPGPPAAQCPKCTNECPSSPAEGQVYQHRVTTACECSCFLPSAQELDDCPLDCGIRFEYQPDGSLDCVCAPPGPTRQVPDFWSHLPAAML